MLDDDLDPFPVVVIPDRHRRNGKFATLVFHVGMFAQKRNLPELTFCLISTETVPDRQETADAVDLSKHSRNGKQILFKC